MRAPIRQALVRQSLWFGCNPLALIYLSGFCALIGIGGGLAFRELVLVPVAAVVFWGGRHLLLRMAKKDPLLPWTYLRAIRYERVYVARSRWDTPERSRKRWA